MSKQEWQIYQEEIRNNHMLRCSIILPGKTEKTIFTHCESVILLNMIAGKRPKEIAWVLNNSLHTINSHIANIKEKISCSNNFQLGFILGKCPINMEEKYTSIH